MVSEKKILILGIGNTLLADEGFGPAAIEYLSENYLWPENVNLVDGATRGLLLMSELLDCDLAIILDIFLGGEAAGTFYSIDGKDVGISGASATSMHQTTLADILFSCELIDQRPETLIMAMEPFEWQKLQAHISLQAQDRLPDFCEKVVEKIRYEGVQVIKNKGNTD